MDCVVNTVDFSRENALPQCYCHSPSQLSAHMLFKKFMIKVVEQFHVSVYGIAVCAVSAADVAETVVL